MAKHIVKCYYCNQEFDANSEAWIKVNTRRYAHRKCYDENHQPGSDIDPDDIYYFLKDVVHLAVDYRLFESQRISQIKKNGYTNFGILQALKYWYIVKQNSPDKANGGIGIVPYIYADAQKYYEELGKKQKQISKSLKKSLEETQVTTIVIPVLQEKENKKYINLDDIGKEEEW